MLAYSSITHAGVIMLGLLAGGRSGIAGVLYYLLVYSFMNMGAFAVVTLLVRGDGGGELISDYKGLSSRHPVLSILMSLFLISLTGIPPTAGFAAKFFILSSAVDAGYYWLSAIAVISTAVSLFFYVKVIFYMYMKEGGEAEARVGTGFEYAVVLILTAIATVALGVYPAPFIEAAISAIAPFFV
jgi:NADH-quinone oxidoreductase subunit N